MKREGPRDGTFPSHHHPGSLALLLPGPPAPRAHLLPLSRSRPSSPGFARHYMDSRVLVPTSPPKPLSRSSNLGPKPPDGSKNPCPQIPFLVTP